MTEKKGRFARLFQHIANHVPMGILDSLHLDRRHSITIPDTFTNITTTAGLEFPSIGTLTELRGYLVKLYKYYDPMGDGSDIFSQRHFLGVIDKLIEAEKKWFGELDSNQKGFIIEWLLKVENNSKIRTG